MCQHALFSYQCGHHKLLRIETCETHKQDSQLASQLNEKLRPQTVETAKITFHYLDEGIPVAADVAAEVPGEKESVNCKNVDCHAGFTFDTAMTTASRLLTSIQQTNTSYNDLHDKWLAKHFALQKFQILATPKYLAARPKLKTRLEKHKEWARDLVKVEKRLVTAERVLFTGMGDVEWLKTRIVMPVEWKRVIRDVHHARVELGLLRWKVEGEECW